MYLLGVLSADRTSEITSLLALNHTYQALPSYLPSHLTSSVLTTALSHHTKRFFNPTYAGLISSLTAEKAVLPPQPHTRNSSIRSVSMHNRSSSVAQQSRSSPNAGPDYHRPPPSFSLPEPESSDGLTLRSQYVRFLPPPPSSTPSRHTYLALMEEVLGKYWNAEKDKGRDDEWRRLASGVENGERDWVYLATPFVCCLTRPVAVFLGFQKLMEKLGTCRLSLGIMIYLTALDVETFPPLPSRLASMLTLFRLSLPELFSYFEDEQVPYVEVGVSWCRSLLAKEMWLENVLRLWGGNRIHLVTSPDRQG